MRVAIVTHEYPPVGGGASTAAERTAHALVGLGHEVLVVTAAAPGQPARSHQRGVRLRRLPALRLRALAPSGAELLSFGASAALLLTRELSRFGAEGILAYFAVPAGPFARVAARRLDVPLVVSLRGSDVPGFPGGRLEGRLGALMRPVVRRTLADADHVAPNSEVLRQLALTFMPELDGKLTLVPNGIEPSTIAAAPASSPTGGPLELVVLGQLIARKRVHLAIEAVALLGDLDVRLTVIGDGPLQGELARLADRRGVAGRVVFAGHLPRAAVPGRLRASDLMLMTSEGEGMSNAVLEAIAAGLPVVTTASGSHDVVEAAGAGEVVAADAGVLAVRTRALLGAPDHRRALGAAGLAWARRHTWADTARRFAELLAARSV